MIGVKIKGDWGRTDKYFKRASNIMGHIDLDKYGQRGVEALSAATPVDTGLTANSWYYEIEKSNGITSILFCNANVQNGVPIAIILQYGHGTRNGGWVQGRDYINPALQPIFDDLADAAWREVTRP